MKWWEVKEYLAVWGTILGVLALIVSVIVWFESCRCNAGWSRSGMETDWGPFQGCLVEVSKDRWIPSDRVREVDLPKGE